MPFSASSLMLSLRTMFDPDKADGFAARLGFVVGGQSFLAHVAEGRIEIAAETPDTADVVLAAAPPVIAGAVYGKVPLAALEAEGALTVTGDRAVAERFVALFALPPKAEAKLAATAPE